MNNKPKYKLNYLKLYGRVYHNKTEWIFKAQPGRNCPVLEWHDKSKWNLVDNLFSFIHNNY